MSDIKIRKKFVLLEVNNKTIDREVILELNLGSMDYGYGHSSSSRTTEFDTEEEAIEYAHKHNKWLSWMIIPIIRFDNN